jgi:hypothetical protein
MADTTDRTDDLAVQQYGATDPRASHGARRASKRGNDDQPEAPDQRRLTPQGHISGTVPCEDSTDPRGGAK